MPTNIFVFIFILKHKYVIICKYNLIIRYDYENNIYSKYLSIPEISFIRYKVKIKQCFYISE